MATTAMMLWSILKPDALKARAMYRNLQNLVDKAMVQQAEINRQVPIEAYKRDPNI